MSRFIAAIIAVGILVVLLMMTVATVPAGHVGVVDVFGRVNDATLAPGLHLINPLARVHRMSVQTSEIKEVMDTPSSEGLIVHLEISTIYHLNPDKAVEVYKTVGLEYDSILIHPNIRSAVRETTTNIMLARKPTARTANSAPMRTRPWRNSATIG